MNVFNVEIYSMIIISILLLDYIAKFRGKFNIASLIWITLAISDIAVSASNLLLNFTDNFAIKVILMSIYLLGSVMCSLSVYVYVKCVYVNTKSNIKKEAYYTFASIIICILVAILYVVISNKGYAMHSFDRAFFNKLLILALIPNIAICFIYIYNTLKNKGELNLKIIGALLITIIGLILDILNESLFFVSSTFTLTALMMYINKHQKLLFTDPLTGLLNKWSLEVFIEHLRPNLNVSVYNMDINSFKKINDTYGHLKGDYALKKLAEILRNSSRDRDLVIRNGGDEFLVIAIVRKEEDATKLLERINENLDEYNKNAEIKISISTGWGLYKSTEKTTMADFNEFLKKIDQDMYKEKAIAHQSDNTKKRRKHGRNKKNIEK